MAAADFSHCQQDTGNRHEDHNTNDLCHADDAKRVRRRNEPVLRSDEGKNHTQDGRADSAVPGTESYRRKERDVWYVVAQKGIQSQTDHQSYYSREESEDRKSVV